MSARPNFLFIITDQHRADYLGCYGHPVLRTPHIDGIAASGVCFDRFYVANPICMPNRSTLMTGRMPSLHGVRHNGIALSLRANTFVDLLRTSGWRTALIGKSHLQNFESKQPQLKRTQPRPGRKLPVPEFAEAVKPLTGDGPYNQEQPESWRADSAYKLKTPFYGFEHVALCTLHGDEVGGHYHHWLAAKHPNADKLRGPENALAHDYTCPQAWRTAIPEELYPTAYIAEKSIEYLDEHKRTAGDKPFFLMCSFPDPHHPWTPPGKYWDMYKPADMALPGTFRRGNMASPPHVAWLHEQLAKGTAIRTSPSPFAVTEREAREALALTCGMIAMVDDAVGRIMARLRALGLDKDTVVVFTSDHGDYLGDHGLMLKGPIHYQSLIRVPFIWAEPPGVAQRGRNAALCGTLDLANTVIDRAGLEPFNGIQGRSLVPIMSDGADDGNDSVLIEEDGQRNYMGFEGVIRCRTIVTRRHRMTIYHGVKWGELYDLENDPGENENLFDDPAHAPLRGELMERMARRQMALVDRSPLPTALA